MKVDSKSIKSASFHRRLPIWRHLYAWPFVPIYAFFLFRHVTEPSGFVAEYAFFAYGALVSLNILVFLLGQWSIRAKVFISYSNQREPLEGDFVLLESSKHQLKRSICQIRRHPNDAEFPLYFEHQKKMFVYDTEKHAFRKLDYPVRNDASVYLDSTGCLKIDFAKALDRYGTNCFEIPIPSFQALFKEHAAAPFFVFQVFCVCLWFMDEYWYYSLFTLAMLFVFESTVVHQRLRNLRELRSMSQQPYDVFVYRDLDWLKVKTEQLVPGDVVSVTRGATDDHTVPCDILLLYGECIVNEAMLSGESTPLIKESLAEKSFKVFDVKNTDFKGNVLFGGTRILQNTAASVGKWAKNAPPDNGCIGYVLRTGFGTTQGKLVRTMIYSTERVSANNAESFLFIAFLLVFAIGAAWNVWIVGLESGRKKSKLLLDCILIVTSVVPPELPMELSLAVNQSLIALARMAIFCLEPFRIPFAGKLDVCCFDKTGTLTEESMTLEGIVGVESGYKVSSLKKVKPYSVLSAITCHSLMKLDASVIGDPMEQAILKASGWTLAKNDLIVPAADSRNATGKIRVVKKYPFSSNLKRMSCITQPELPPAFFKDDSVPVEQGAHFVSVKGAPETLRSMFTELPANYDKVYKHFAMKGSRILALGWKWMRIQGSLKELPREDVECKLIFSGFLLFSSPLKPDTAASINELQESMHRVIMITGDNPLTAVHVAKELRIVRRPVLILDENDRTLSWKSPDGNTEFIYNAKMFEDTKFINSYDFCMTGPALDRIRDSDVYKSILVDRIWVYSRVSPSQKELVLRTLKVRNYMTLMCGDGTNDVKALRISQVGVALLNGTKEDLDKIARNMRERRLKEVKQKQEELYKSWGIKVPGTADEGAAKPADEAVRKRAKQVNSLMEQMDNAAEDIPVLKFGDASAAAPFTSKIGSINSVCNIVRQGRCTLVTTIQMYKILALNCLITAFTLSALYLDGIKYGDTQMTLQGFLLAGCFLFLSWGKPIDRLSRKRPQPNIFNLYILTSVLGQFAVHSVSLWYIVKQTKELLPLDWKPDEEEKTFEPNLLNTTVYLISLSMQVSTFMINYQGRPFRESLRENKPLYMSLVSLLCVAIFGAAEMFPELNEWVELVPMPSRFSETLVGVILADLSVCFAIESVSNWLFSDSKPKVSLGLEDSEWELL